MNRLFLVASLIAFPLFADQTGWVTWTPYGQGGHIAFVKVLLNLAELRPDLVDTKGITKKDEIKAAMCALSVLRPEGKDSPITNAKSNGWCKVVVKDKKTVEMTLDLGSVPIHFFGNRFRPKTFAIKDQDAKDLYRAVLRTQSENPDDLFLSHSDRAVNDYGKDESGKLVPIRTYRWIDYGIPMTAREKDGNNTGPYLLDCTKDFLTNVGAPELDSSRTFCVFTYQLHAD